MGDGGPDSFATTFDLRLIISPSRAFTEKARAGKERSPGILSQFEIG